MKLRYAEPGLHELDTERAVCLVLTAFADDRPLRGLAGRIDWRLNGQLSRLMRDGFIDGHFSEAMLTPLTTRVPFDRLLFVGMGARAEFSEGRFAEICRFTFQTLARMHITDFAMAMPGRIGLDVGLRQALRGWEDGIAATFPAEMIRQLNICLIESADVQRELVEPLRRACRDLDERASGALEAAGLIEPVAPVAIPAVGRPAGDEDEDALSLARRRDWSTGMFRIVDDRGPEPDDDDDEISVADVPVAKRRSGLFTIPDGRSSHDPQLASPDAPAGRGAGGWSRPQTTGSTPRAPRADPTRRGPEFTGARRPSGQFAAVRRASGQYEIPTRRLAADFDARPIAAPSEPLDRVRRVSAMTPRGQTPLATTRPRVDAGPRRTTRPQVPVVTGRSDDAPWSEPAVAAHTQRPGVHVEPPLLQTGQFDEPMLSDEFHLHHSPAGAPRGPTTDQFHAAPVPTDTETGFDPDF